MVADDPNGGFITHEPFDKLEEGMNATAFSSPIFVKNGTYMVQEIADLGDAIDFWRNGRRIAAT